MKAAAEKDGVNVSYMVDSSTATGTCAVCIVDKERSLVANLSAANNYKVDHLKKEENMALLEKAKVVYSAGFFITVCPDAIALASKHCNEKGKTYCMNLSAPFIMEVPPFKECLKKTMPYIDILFGNETEAATYAKTEGWSETDIPSIAAKLSKLPKEGKPRTVVITQGASPTIIAVDGELREYPIIKLPKSKLKDTNGAGDAYVGGFLYGLVQDKDMDYCTKAAAYAASVIVQRSGCTFPAKPSFRPPPPPKPLKKPRIIKIEKFHPEQRGVTIICKVVKVSDAEGGPEAVLGDESGQVTCILTEDQKAVAKEGAILRVQNAKIVMRKGYMRLQVDKWAVMKPAAEDTPGGKPDSIEVKTDKDVSAVEFELSG
jgi:adenosine kinase